MKKHNSKIITGCMSWGKWGKKLSINEQAELIRYCVENGITSFDHADIYGDHTTESDFGKALKKSGVTREEIHLISKCGIQLVSENRSNSIKHYNYSEDYIIRCAEESLRHLKTDYLDTFLLHRPSPLMQPDEIAKVINQLQEKGKIIRFGVSNFTPSQLELVSNSIKVSVNQIEFSLTHHEAMQNGTLDHMVLNNIQPMSWSPLGKVFKEKNSQTKRIKEVLSTLSKKYNYPEDTIMLAWILKHPSGISPVIGTTNKERIKNAVKALEITLETEDWFKLLRASQGHDVP